MDACAACGTRVEDGLTKCPQCGANLARPGAFLQMMGWVTIMISLIPLSAGFVTIEQRSFAPLGLGIAMILAGVIMIVTGRIQTSNLPPTTTPLSMPRISSIPEPTPEAKAKEDEARQGKP